LRRETTKRFGLGGEGGQALVELALAIPLLLFVLFAIIDFGLAINQYNDTTNLANLGARALAVISSTNSTPSCTYTTGPGTTTTSTSLSTYLQCEGQADGVNLGPGKLTVVSCDMTSASTYATGDTIRVTVAAPFSWLKIITGGDGRIGGIGNLASSVSSSATMREEGSNTSTPSWATSANTNTTSC